MEAVSDGSFGEVSSPVFIDRLDCLGNEERIINYGVQDDMSTCDSSRVGFVLDDCGLDLGVRCPGKLEGEGRGGEGGGGGGD